MKVICPFCNAELDSKDDEPDLVRDKDGNVIYTCHMVKCSNIDKHPSKNDIVVIFNPEEK